MGTPPFAFVVCAHKLCKANMCFDFGAKDWLDEAAEESVKAGESRVDSRSLFDCDFNRLLRTLSVSYFPAICLCK